MTSSFRYAIMCALLLLLSGCGSNKPLLIDGEIPPNTSISLERTTCLGNCPTYTVTITADGSVTFNGRQHVRISGLQQDAIPVETVRELIGEFERISFFDYRDQYGYGAFHVCEDLWTDAPSTITTITIQDRSKQVEHYHGCRGFAGEAELTNLEELIDETANTAQWIQTP